MYVEPDRNMHVSKLNLVEAFEHTMRPSANMTTASPLARLITFNGWSYLERRISTWSLLAVNACMTRAMLSEIC